MHALQDFRSREGLTQERLAKMLGVTQEAIAHWENGRRKISAERALEFEGLLKHALDQGQVQAALTRHDLRPDIFGPAPMHDDCRCRESAA